MGLGKAFVLGIVCAIPYSIWRAIYDCRYTYPALKPAGQRRAMREDCRSRGL